MNMPLVYLAGPYSPKSTEFGRMLAEVNANIARADELGRKLLALGVAVIVPHKNTRHWDADPNLTYERFLAMDEVLIKRCDGIVLLPGWEDSKGALREKALATKLGLPIFTAADYCSVDRLAEAIKGFFYRCHTECT